jgi:type II secretion system protein H
MGTSDGYTLVEVLVAMVVFGLIAAFGTQGWLHYTRAQELRSGVDQLMAVMRNAQERSLAEATTYCISFGTDNRSYTLWKFACGAGGSQQGAVMKTPSTRVTFPSAAFTQSDGSTAAQVTFTPRGSATPGRVTVKRTGANKTYTLSVEGLTGRVSLG